MITRLLTVAAVAAASVSVAVSGAHAASAPFYDNFDGAVHASPTFGLNDNLKHRQGTGAVTYSRTSPDGSVEVNHPKYPGALLMRPGSTVVRLDAPSTGSGISASLTPVAGGASDGWSSIVLSRSANIVGDVSDPETDLGFRLRANGSVQVSSLGKVVADLPAFAKARSGGPFDVALKLAAGTVDVTVNGKRKTIKLDVPTERQWVYLGRHADDAQAVSLVDNLKVAALNSDDLRKRPGSSLRYYGYLDAGVASVRGHSNLNVVSAAKVGACAPASCLVRTDVAGWVDRVRPHLGRVVGFVAHDGNAELIKSLFPDKKVMLAVAGSQIDDSFVVPPAVDWVGFHEYCAAYPDLEARMAKLEERVADKELLLMPEGSPQAPCADLTDPDIAGTQYMYLALIQQFPRYVGFLVTAPPVDFSRTVDAQERVAALVLGDARLSG
ncbi:hypothetical protein LFM09_37510 [Lentzea alba]|uniref:hypothetical protein n=1 Tax=Lentzea alba TaxID=2714351 RepID=UPI0039BF83A9